jgi:ketosteroid isomerase-like protein
VEEVRRAVDLWATAWSSKDSDAYLACYADDFSPAGGKARDEWEVWRRERLAAPRFIKVEIADVDVTMLGEDHAQAAFWQTYQSDSINDRIRKTLLLKKAGTRWLIAQETIR